jgi:predicted acetyltransferase
MTPTIRAITLGELPAFVEAMTTTFFERPDAAKVAAELEPLWDLGRCHAAFDGARMCGTFRSWATELTVPGGERLPGSAIAGVSVLPTHRRRGILRALAAAEHGAIRERGEVVGLLFSAEYPIYGRFGYGPSTRQATWTLDALGTAFHGTSTGSIEIVKPNADAAAAMRAVFEAVRLTSPGEIRRRDFRWEFDLGRATAWGDPWKGFVALRRDGAGAVDGYVRYHAEDRWEQRQPRMLVIVDDLHATSDEAYLALWRFLAEADLVGAIKAERRSVAERLPWFVVNARAAVVSEVGDGLWVRLFDMPRALEARTYEREARLVLEVVDPDGGDGRQRLALDAGPDGATCRPTDRSADLTVPVAALGAAYLGGTRLRDAVVAHGHDEHADGALTRADALFRTANEPWCSTFF